MTEWSYNTFYEWYKTHYKSFQNDNTKIVISEFQKINKKRGGIETFYYSSEQCYHTRKIPSLKVEHTYPEEYPHGLYIFFNPFEKLKKEKRFYFLFPSYKVVNKDTKETNLIADHYTFLDCLDKKDKTPIKSHITFYYPSGKESNKQVGYSENLNFYLPRTIEIASIEHHQYFENLVNMYKHCIKELLLKPYEELPKEQIGNGNPRKLKEKIITTNKNCSNKMKVIMNKYHIKLVRVIGIKFADMKHYDYTVFILTDVPDNNCSESEEDSCFELRPAPSFTFQSKWSSFTHIQNKLVSTMDDWNKETWAENY
jgi:hypothetical protein